MNHVDAARDLWDLRAEPAQPHVVQPHRLAAASGGTTTRAAAGEAGRESVLATLTDLTQTLESRHCKAVVK